MSHWIQRPWGHVKPPSGSRPSGLAGQLGIIWACLFNEGGSTSVVDVINGLVGAFTGTVLWDGSLSPLAGPFGPGLCFNGNGAYVEFPLNVPLTKPSGAMTLRVWTAGSGSTDGSLNNSIGGTSIGTMADDGARGYSITLLGDAGSSGDATFSIAAGASPVTSVTASGANNRNVWTCWHGVYVPSVSLTLYQNGVQAVQNTTSIPASQYTGNGVPLRLGARVSNGTYFIGGLDLPLIANIAWTPQQVLADYMDPFAWIGIPRRRVRGQAAASGFDPSAGFPWQSTENPLPQRRAVVAY